MTKVGRAIADRPSDLFNLIEPFAGSENNLTSPNVGDRHTSPETPEVKNEDQTLAGQSGRGGS